MYRLIVVLKLEPIPESEASATESTNSPPADPVKRDGVEIGRMAGVLETFAKRGFGPEPIAPTNSLKAMRSYDCPATDYTELLAILKEFDVLGQKFGAPAPSVDLIRTVPSPVMSAYPF